jgi:hypothetical protein
MASNALLEQIQAGKKLRKAKEISDRSAPDVGSKPKGGGGGSLQAVPPAVPALTQGGGPPQLGSLFAGGMPQLRSVNQNAKNGAYSVLHSLNLAHRFC